MEAQNSKKVARGYTLFTIAMCCSIMISVVCVWSFVITSNIEVTRIELRSMEYDRTLTQQITLAEKIDFIFANIKSLDDGGINHAMVQGRVSMDKTELIGILNNLHAADISLYRKFHDIINPALQVKDSIRLLSFQEQQLRIDLQRCIQSNRNVTR
jgi:hypothetical protein